VLIESTLRNILAANSIGKLLLEDNPVNEPRFHARESSVLEGQRQCRGVLGVFVVWVNQLIEPEAS